MKKRKKINLNNKYFQLVIFLLFVLALSMFILDNKRKYSPQESIDDYTDEDGWIKNYCESEQRNVDFCVEHYYPVCGHDSRGKVIGEFSNDCYACKDPKVDYIFYRECN